MLDKVNEENHKYRWLILALTWLTAISLFTSINQLAPLSVFIIEDLGISAAAFGLLYSSPMFGVACMAVIAGAASDRFGPRIIVCLGLTLVSFFAVSRSFAASIGSYNLMLTCNLLMGLAFGMSYPNLPKLVSDWFPASQRGLATSVYTTGIPFGSTSALMLTIPVILVLAGGSWTKVPLVWGILPTTVAVLLWSFCRNSPTFISSKEKTNNKFFNKAVYSTKVLWLVGGSFFLRYLGLLCMYCLVPFDFSIQRRKPAGCGHDDGLAAAFRPVGQLDCACAFR